MSGEAQRHHCTHCSYDQEGSASDHLEQLRHESWWSRRLPIQNLFPWLLARMKHLVVVLVYVAFCTKYSSAMPMIGAESHRCSSWACIRWCCSMLSQSNCRPGWLVQLSIRERGNVVPHVSWAFRHAHPGLVDVAWFWPYCCYAVAHIVLLFFVMSRFTPPSWRCPIAAVTRPVALAVHTGDVYWNAVACLRWLFGIAAAGDV